jgi:hypothetical protein
VALNLPSATFIGYSSRGDFFGEDIARWRTVQTVTIEGVMNPTKVNDMVSSTGETDRHLPTSANSYLGHDVSVNGVAVNNSRLISLDFPTGGGSATEKHDGLAKYIATYEVYIAAASSPENTFFGIEFNDLKALEEFTEDITFDLSEDNNYSVNWSMNITYSSGATGGANGEEAEEGSGDDDESDDGIVAAKALWAKVTASTPSSIPTSMQGNSINIWNKEDENGNDIGWNETEVYDTQNFNCSFTRSRSLLSNNDSDNYTSKINNSLSFKEDGSISVTEEVEVLGLVITAGESEVVQSVSITMDHAKKGAEALLSGSYGRCNTLYNSYKNVLGTESYSLIDQYVSKSVSYDEQSSKITYTIEYANSSGWDAGDKYIFESNMSAEMASEGGVLTLNYVEDGVVRSFCRGVEDDYADTPTEGVPDACIELKDALYDKMSSSESRVTSTWSDAATYGVSLISTKINLKPILGNEATFTKTFSSDLALNPPIDGLKKLTKEFNTKAGVIKKEWFNPPNNPNGCEFPHVGAQIVEPSIRTVTYKGVIKRNETVAHANFPTGFKYNNLIYLSSVRDIIKQLIPLMKGDALRVFTEYSMPFPKMYLKKYYYKNFDWSFNSENEFTATLEMEYVVPLGSKLNYPNLHNSNEHIAI